MAKHAKKLTKSKAKKMLKEGKTRGKKLTKKQKRFFGLIAGGGKPTRLKDHPMLMGDHPMLKKSKKRKR